MKNIVVIDKSELQDKYVWEKGNTLIDRIDCITVAVVNSYHNVNNIVCYLDKVSFESFKVTLGKEFVMYSTVHSKLPDELKPMCSRWVQYRGIYFMEERY